jgi:nucleotide-binding universal stress UspA family protein
MENPALMFLEDDGLRVNPRFASLLPPDLAYRYHALPVAGIGDQITVAMADPGDSEARRVISNVIGSSTCIVQTNQDTIDRLISEFWDKAANPSMILLSCSNPSVSSTGVESYTRTLAAILGATICKFETVEAGKQIYQEIWHEVERLNPSIVIIAGIARSNRRRFIEGSLENKLVDQLSPSILVARKPRWPLRRILLVLKNVNGDQASVDWTIRIAQPSFADVTVLPLTMPIPVIYEQIYQIRSSIADLLTSGSTIGRNLRQVARRLVDSEINSTMRIRPEPLEYQVRFELAERAYDLVVIASEPDSPLSRLVNGDVISPLLSCANCPILVAKPQKVLEYR